MMTTKAAPSFFARFLGSEKGSMTTETIIVSAAILGTAIVSMTQVRNGVEPLGAEVQESLSNAEVAALGTLGTAADD